MHKALGERSLVPTVLFVLAAGILIHTALVGLLHPMFTAGQGHPPLKGWLMAFAMFFALLGCGAMALIAIWA